MALTQSEARFDDAIAAHAGDPERVHVLERAKRFKRSWIELAEVLVHLRRDESWRRWGFDSFDTYCARELRLRRGTVDKLCGSYGFLTAHAPRFTRAQGRDDRDEWGDQEGERAEPSDGGAVPSWQAVDYLARAERRGAVPEATFDEMKRAVFDDGAAAPALARRYREVAFPVGDEERRARLKAQIVATARRLASLVADSDAPLPRRLAVAVEELTGEIITWGQEAPPAGAS